MDCKRQVLVEAAALSLKLGDQTNARKALEWCYDVLSLIGHRHATSCSVMCCLVTSPAGFGFGWLLAWLCWLCIDCFPFCQPQPQASDLVRQEAVHILSEPEIAGW